MAGPAARLLVWQEDRLGLIGRDVLAVNWLSAISAGS